MTDDWLEQSVPSLYLKALTNHHGKLAVGIIPILNQNINQAYEPVYQLCSKSKDRVYEDVSVKYLNQSHWKFNLSVTMVKLPKTS